MGYLLEETMSELLPALGIIRNWLVASDPRSAPPTA
jgi:hypothetical protein